MVSVPEDRLLVSRNRNSSCPPADSPEEFGPDCWFRREIGVLDGRGCWAAETALGVEPPEGSVFRDLRGMFFGMDEYFFRMAGRAKQILGWNATHRFCGRCGARPSPYRRNRREVHAARHAPLPSIKMGKSRRFPAVRGLTRLDAPYARPTPLRARAPSSARRGRGRSCGALLPPPTRSPAPRRCAGRRRARCWSRA